MKLIAIVLVYLALFAQSAVTASRDYPVSECDHRAANPEDQDIIAPAVPRDEMDLPKAIAACEAETSKHPDNARARYQLARSLSYDGQSRRAAEEMKRAADQGYRQAQFVYGLMIDRGRPDMPNDPCIVERYWLKSALAGRQAARVSYVRHALRAKFDSCKVQATPAQMKQFLEAALADAGDYYERLLIEDLSGELAARSKR
jgi:TPR repeat protein